MHQSVAWLSGSQESGWFATGCSEILIFSFFPRPPRDSVNTVIPLVVLSLLLPLSLFAFSLSLSLAQRDTQRGRFNTRTGETPSLRRGVLRERDEIIIAKHLHYKVVVYRVVAGGLWPTGGRRGGRKMEQWRGWTGSLGLGECNTATS